MGFPLSKNSMNYGDAELRSDGQPPFDIVAELGKLPGKPGVYIMHGADGAVIYVGKAVNLKNRVRQYFHSAASHSPKVAAMASRVARFEYIVTGSEFEALLLECNLIKEHRPRYNVMLVDDKHYPFIKVTVNEEYPRLLVVRKIVADGARYFGPYLNVVSITETISELRRAFPLKSCNRLLPRDIGKGRPCLNKHIGLCLGPCSGEVSASEYRSAIDDAMLFLEGKREGVSQGVEGKMQAASEDMRFEEAARLRDRLYALRHIQEKQRVFSTASHDQDIVACHMDGADACVSVFFVRGGKLVGRDNMLFEGEGQRDAKSLLAGFVKAFYAGECFVPNEIILQERIDDMKLVERMISRRCGKRAAVVAAVRGERRAMAELVRKNAGVELRNRRAAYLAEESRIREGMAELRESLGLPARYGASAAACGKSVESGASRAGDGSDAGLPPAPIRRVEAFDVSNYGANDKVASMVVFDGGRPLRAAYRRFRIRSVVGLDDYACMREAIARRLSRLARSANRQPDAQGQGDAVPCHEAAALRRNGALPCHEAARLCHDAAASGREQARLCHEADEPCREASTPAQAAEGFLAVPDLLLVDGGKGHVTAALSVLEELGLSIPVAGMAKNDSHETSALVTEDGEWVPLAGRPQLLRLVSSIQDEAHRFAIAYSRKLAERRLSMSELDDIRGVGKRRKMALIGHFKSMKRIREAEVSALASVPGIDGRTAKAIYARYHPVEDGGPPADEQIMAAAEACGLAQPETGAQGAELSALAGLAASISASQLKAGIPVSQRKAGAHVAEPPAQEESAQAEPPAQEESAQAEPPAQEEHVQAEPAQQEWRMA